jgi:hypothetical protein
VPDTLDIVDAVPDCAEDAARDAEEDACDAEIDRLAPRVPSVDTDHDALSTGVVFFSRCTHWGEQKRCAA